MAFYAYILASRPYGTLYTGSTEGLVTRVWQHKHKIREGFTAKYGIHRLVWFEAFDTRDGAFRRERRIKKWNRAWKIRLIEEANPRWDDLYEELTGADLVPVIPLLPVPPSQSPADGEGQDLS